MPHKSLSTNWLVWGAGSRRLPRGASRLPGDRSTGTAPGKGIKTCVKGESNGGFCTPCGGGRGKVVEWGIGVSDP